jgi:hypothetical protein
MCESGDRWQRIDEVFTLAVETPPEQRAAVIEKACGTDPELRRDVERLLEADARAHGFLETLAGQLCLGETATTDNDESGRASLDLLPDGRLLADRYRILKVIGRGGMGAVYRAHEATLGSEVAVKVLDWRRTRDPARVEAFRREVKLKRRVSHPNLRIRLGRVRSPNRHDQGGRGGVDSRQATCNLSLLLTIVHDPRAVPPSENTQGICQVEPPLSGGRYPFFRSRSRRISSGACLIEGLSACAE